MKRDPSLHITKSNLARILDEIEYTTRTSGVSLADSIMRAAMPYQIRDRYLEVMEQKKEIRAKVQKSVQADQDITDEDVGKFNLILHSVRAKKNPHISIKPILRNSKDYLMLKEVAVLALQFCENFDITNKHDGFTEYVNVGLNMMRKYALNRFKYYDSKIHENLEMRITLAKDPNNSRTKEFRDMLEAAMKYYTGGMDYFIKEDDWDSLTKVYLAREQADEEEADYETWIIGQFEGLAFLGVLPELSQFYGDNAAARYKKHLIAITQDKTENEESITNKYEDYEEN